MVFVKARYNPDSIRQSLRKTQDRNCISINIKIGIENQFGTAELNLRPLKN